MEDFWFVYFFLPLSPPVHTPFCLAFPNAFFLDPSSQFRPKSYYDMLRLLSQGDIQIIADPVMETGRSMDPTCEKQLCHPAFSDL